MLTGTMNQLNTNFSVYFAVAAASLAAGYYLGQILPSASKKEHVQQILRQCKQRAEFEESEESDEEEEDDEDDEDDEEYEIDSVSLNDVPGEVRMALVIRQDLGMQKGKTAAQCAHAALGCFRMIGCDSHRKSYNPSMVYRWLRGGQAKITLKCPDESTMDELYALAIALGVNACVIHDAGRTQIAAGSATVLGLGPAPKAVLDQITGELKLY
ncbi:gluconate transport-inducing protein [Zygosaccharomyces mellis]|uniref:peptidyl-tRNA hydrolase n=1 Tax=Zygosaccharomyces mellis TaxID=42258 RepID=A0A4C2E548_9SACH|nr:gluconate transport-inducing protein [Zygosaccharomyces mellis]